MPHGVAIGLKPRSFAGSHHGGESAAERPAEANHLPGAVPKQVEPESGFVRICDTDEGATLA